jgi:hypothetical protein
MPWCPRNNSRTCCTLVAKHPSAYTGDVRRPQKVFQALVAKPTSTRPRDLLPSPNPYIKPRLTATSTSAPRLGHRDSPDTGLDQAVYAAKTKNTMSPSFQFSFSSQFWFRSPGHLHNHYSPGAHPDSPIPPHPSKRRWGVGQGQSSSPNAAQGSGRASRPL